MHHHEFSDTAKNNFNDVSKTVLESSAIFFEQIQKHQDAKESFVSQDKIQKREMHQSIKLDHVVFYPNKLIAEALAAGKELQALSSSYKLSDGIHHNDESGKFQETAAERIESLRKKINENCQKAIIASNELIKQYPHLENDIQIINSKLQRAAKQMGLDRDDANFSKVIQNSQRYGKLKHLADEQALLQSIRMAPGTALLTYAMLKAEGLTDDPQTSLESLRTTGSVKPSKQELNDAFLLVSQAGRTNSEVFNSPFFASVNASIKAEYAQTQQVKGQQIVSYLKEADQCSQHGDSSSAEAKYKQAWQIAESIDQKFLLAQLTIRENRDNPQVSQALMSILSDVKEARMHYANFLVKEGKYEDGLPILLTVGADTPEFAQADPTYNKLVSEATFGRSIPQGELQAHQARFVELMQDTSDPNRVIQAQKELDALVKNYQETKATLEKVQIGLDASKKEIESKILSLEKQKDVLNPEEYKIEKHRLGTESKAIEDLEKQNLQFFKQGTYLKYLQGVLAFSKDDKDTAHALFEEVKRSDPELAKNQANNLDELLEATKHQNWFQRNWQTLATVGAIAAGIAVGIVLLPTGPVGVLAGVGTTTAIMSTIGAGAAAGALTYSGIKGTAIGFNNVGLRDIKDGAILGASSALTITGGPLFGASATTSTRLGLNLRTISIGAGTAATKEGLDMAVDGKSFSQAAQDFLLEAPLYATNIGITGKTVLSSAPLALRISKAALQSAGMQSGPELYKLADATYHQMQEHVLDANKPEENARISNKFYEVNPSMYRPEFAVSTRERADNLPVKQTKPLTEDLLEQLRAKKIEDEQL